MSTCQHNPATTRLDDGSCRVCRENDILIVRAAADLAALAPGHVIVSGPGGSRRDEITFVRASEDPAECEVRWMRAGQEHMAVGFDIAFNWSGWVLTRS